MGKSGWFPVKILYFMGKSMNYLWFSVLRCSLFYQPIDPTAAEVDSLRFRGFQFGDGPHSLGSCHCMRHGECGAVILGCLIQSKHIGVICDYMWWYHVISCCIMLYHLISFYTSSTAQGGGGSFKDRKPIGGVACCDASKAEQIHWWIERWLERRPIYLSISLPLYRSDSLTNYLTNYLTNSLTIWQIN